MSRTGSQILGLRRGELGKHARRSKRRTRRTPATSESSRRVASLANWRGFLPGLGSSLTSHSGKIRSQAVYYVGKAEGSEETAQLQRSPLLPSRLTLLCHVPDVVALQSNLSSDTVLSEVAFWSWALGGSCIALCIVPVLSGEGAPGDTRLEKHASGFSFDLHDRPFKMDNPRSYCPGLAACRSETGLRWFPPKKDLPLANVRK